MNRVFSAVPKLLAVIGDPISHSLSPVMHQAAIDAAGLNYLYIACHVTPRKLATFVQTVRSERSLAGFNVTLPHKEKIIRHLDGITDVARAIGAVNTVYWKQDKLWGTNTDSLGFQQALLALKQPYKGKAACVFGAGGASRAIVYALEEFGFSRIILVNRTVKKARALAHAFASYFPKSHVDVLPWEFSVLQNVFSEIDYFINTTSIGLSGDSFPRLPFKVAKPSAVACDIIYRPARTPFLQLAHRHGLRCQNGMPMFIGQGAMAFKLWTGKSPDVQIMEEALQADF